MRCRVLNLSFDPDLSLRNQRFTSNISVTVIDHRQNGKKHAFRMHKCAHMFASNVAVQHCDAYWSTFNSSSSCQNFISLLRRCFRFDK